MHGWARAKNRPVRVWRSWRRRELLRLLDATPGGAAATYFDLIGLPPSTEEAQAFLEDRSTDGYEKLVDRLLADPRFGERWGRHWLDLARYADTQGFEADRENFHMWRYRDYVIDAFNSDKPYDRFIQEQLAGDEMPVASWRRSGDRRRDLRQDFCAWVRGSRAQYDQEVRQMTLDEITGTVGSVFLE